MVIIARVDDMLGAQGVEDIVGRFAKRAWPGRGGRRACGECQVIVNRQEQRALLLVE